MRLRRQAEFDAVFRGGARVHGEQVMLVGKLGAPGIRLGVPCGKRYSKRAVDRNRGKRLLHCRRERTLYNATHCSSSSSKALPLPYV